MTTPYVWVGPGSWVHSKWPGLRECPHSVVQLPGAGSNESVSVRAYGWRRYRQDVHRRSCVLTGQGAR